MHSKRTEPPRETREAWTECFLLCDYARAEHGKLYIVGGGWDEIVPHRLPLDYSTYLGIKLIVQWDLIVAQALVRIELLDQEGKLLGEPVAETRLEGSPIDVPAEFVGLRPFATLLMGTEVKMTVVAAGVYALRLSVNELEVASLRFRVVAPREPRQEAKETP